MISTKSNLRSIASIFDPKIVLLLIEKTEIELIDKSRATCPSKYLNQIRFEIRWKFNGKFLFNRIYLKQFDERSFGESRKGKHFRAAVLSSTSDVISSFSLIESRFETNQDIQSTFRELLVRKFFQIYVIFCHIRQFLHLVSSMDTIGIFLEIFLEISLEDLIESPQLKNFPIKRETSNQRLAFSLNF